MDEVVHHLGWRFKFIVDRVKATPCIKSNTTEKWRFCEGFQDKHLDEALVHGENNGNWVCHGKGLIHWVYNHCDLQNKANLSPLVHYSGNFHSPCWLWWSLSVRLSSIKSSMCILGFGALQNEAYDLSQANVIQMDSNIREV